jgi:hypothetical protein
MTAAKKKAPPKRVFVTVDSEGCLTDVWASRVGAEKWSTKTETVHEYALVEPRRKP